MYATKKAMRKLVNSMQIRDRGMVMTLFKDGGITKECLEMDACSQWRWNAEVYGLGDMGCWHFSGFSFVKRYTECDLLHMCIICCWVWSESCYVFLQAAYKWLNILVVTLNGAAQVQSPVRGKHLPCGLRDIVYALMVGYKVEIYKLKWNNQCMNTCI